MKKCVTTLIFVAYGTAYSHRPVKVPMLATVHCRKHLQWHGSAGTGLGINGKSPGPTNLAFSPLNKMDGKARVRSYPVEAMEPGCTVRKQPGEGSVMCWATL